MIGIYKFTNKINNKIYIGLSNDIERRYREHINNAILGKDHVYLHEEIKKYGIDNFTFEVVETFDINDRDLLAEREKYWISYYDSYYNGYNNTTGGDLSNGRPKLTSEDVINIRTRYANRERCMVVYQDYANRINRTGFNKIWKGETWKYIMPEVYTPENREYHKQHTGNPGAYNGRAKVTIDDVKSIKKRKQLGESAKSIWQDYKTKLTYTAFSDIYHGYSWKNINIDD